MIDGVTIWDNAVVFVSTHFFLVDELCHMIKSRAQVLQISIAEIVIRPAFAYDVDHCIVIDTELICDKDAQFRFLDDICNGVSSMELWLTKENIRVIHEYIFLQVNRQHIEEKRDGVVIPERDTDSILLKDIQFNQGFHLGDPQTLYVKVDIEFVRSFLREDMHNDETFMWAMKLTTGDLLAFMKTDTTWVYPRKLIWAGVRE